MPSYFSAFPKIYYDAAGQGDYKLVTNLLRRVQIKEGLKESAALFDLYDIQGEDTPESVSEQYYGDQKFYWIILLFNNVKDRFYDWPMTSVQFEAYINENIVTLMVYIIMKLLNQVVPQHHLTTHTKYK